MQGSKRVDEQESTLRFLRYFSPDLAKQQELLGWIDTESPDRESSQSPEEMPHDRVPGAGESTNRANSTPAREVEDRSDLIQKFFTMKWLVQATLPHNKSTESVHTRTNGSLKLKIVADDVGLPYGTYARLILIWIFSEAVRNESPLIHLGKLSGFLRKLGVKSTGGKTGTIGNIKDQMRRLFSSTLMLRYEDEEKEAGKNVNIASAYLLWSNDRKESVVELDMKFFEELMAHPIPIDFKVIQRLRRSSLALDIYCWLSYRLSYLRKETMISWDQLIGQFGVRYANIRHFRAKFKAALAKMSDLFPETRVRPNVGGVLLMPAKTRKIPPVDGTGALDVSPSDSGCPDDRISGCGAPFDLDTKTREAAKRIAPHLDIDYLFHEWKEWIVKHGKLPPRNPRNAFLGFVRKK